MAEDELPEPTKMTLGEHLDELRRRIIYALLGLVAAMCVTFAVAKDILHLLERPYIHVMTRAGLEPSLHFRSAESPVMTFFDVAMKFGVVLAAPWIFWQLWKFVSAGLYPRERRYVMTLAPFSALLFVAGAAFFLFLVSEQLIGWFIEFGLWMGLTPEIMLQEYVSLVLTLMLLFAISFQMPLVVYLLAKVGLVSVRTFNRIRRHVIVGILIVAAILTPPDVFSQMCMAVPMYLLYELGVLLAWIACRKKTADEEIE